MLSMERHSELVVSTQALPVLKFTGMSLTIHPCSAGEPYHLEGKRVMKVLVPLSGGLSRQSAAHLELPLTTCGVASGKQGNMAKA